MNQNGDILFLEMNSNPSVFYKEGEYGSADEILALDKEHGSHQGFLELILKAALNDFTLRDKNLKLCY
jgi:hypothetical protein